MSRDRRPFRQAEGLKARRRPHMRPEDAPGTPGYYRALRKRRRDERHLRRLAMLGLVSMLVFFGAGAALIFLHVRAQDVVDSAAP
jgi:hypothetical protein